MAKRDDKGGKLKSDLSHLGRGQLGRFAQQDFVPRVLGDGEAARSGPTEQINRLYVDVSPAPDGGLEGHSPASEIMPVVREFNAATAAMVGPGGVRPGVEIQAKWPKPERAKAALAVAEERAAALAEPKNRGGRPALGKPWEALGISRALYFKRKALGTLPDGEGGK